MKFYLLLLTYSALVYGNPSDCPPGQEKKAVDVKCAGAEPSSDCRDHRELCLDIPGALAGRQNSRDDIDQETKNTVCPDGQHAALVFDKCPAPVDPFDCGYVAIKCVMNEGTISLTPETGATRTPKTDAELEREMKKIQCPSAKKPARVRNVCPGPTDNKDCSDFRIECVNKSPDEEPPRKIGYMVQYSDDQLKWALDHDRCPFGERTAYVVQRCPPGPLDKADCPATRVRCVPISFVNTPPTDGTLAASSPRSLAALEEEMRDKKCESGLRPALVKLECGDSPWDRAGCSHTEVRCVPSRFGYDQPGKEDPRIEFSQWFKKTLRDLRKDMTWMDCWDYQTKALVKESCPKGARSSSECPRAQVSCVNTEPTVPRPGYVIPSVPAKTQETLDHKMMTMVCPADERAAQVTEKCPYSEFDVWHCPPTVMRCLKKPFGNDESDWSPSAYA